MLVVVCFFVFYIKKIGGSGVVVSLFVCLCVCVLCLCLICCCLLLFCCFGVFLISFLFCFYIISFIYLLPNILNSSRLQYE